MRRLLAEPFDRPLAEVLEMYPDQACVLFFCQRDKEGRPVMELRGEPGDGLSIETWQDQLRASAAVEGLYLWQAEALYGKDGPVPRIGKPPETPRIETTEGA